MVDIELVIKMPKEKYDIICNMYETFPAEMKEWGLEYIKNGILLPKGHGDLIDAKELKKAFMAWSMAVHGNFTDVDIASIICHSQKIIEEK